MERVLAANAERRLAAVMAADVVGYSRMMHDDEVGTHSDFMAMRQDLLDPQIRLRGGRIFKSTGDGVLVEFPSPLEAVACAIEVQKLIAVRNRDRPASKQLVLRIGLNVGELLVEADDVFGDDVNIAVRLEGLSPPGGICVSSALHEQVRQRLPLSLSDLGERQVKNIPGSLRVYGLTADEIASVPDGFHPLDLSPDDRIRAASAATTVAAARAARRLAIAVMPFTNLGGDPEQEYFADGIVEEIINTLSHFRNLFVIARNSTFTYKGRMAEPRQIGRELGVRYVVEGSIQRELARLRIKARSLDTESGGHIWSDSFNGDAADVFAFQDAVAAGVVTAVEPRIRASEIERARRKPAESLDAYDYYLRALPLRLALTGPTNDQALALLTKAIELDPTYAPALAHAAACYLAMNDQGWKVLDRDEMGEGLRLARAAIEADMDDPVALCLSGHTIASLTGDFSAGLAWIDRGINLNPSYAEGWMRSGMVRVYANDLSAAIEHSQRAIELSPLDPKTYHPLCAQGYAYLFMGEHERALEQGRRALLGKQKPEMAYRIVIAALAQLDRGEEMRANAAALLRDRPGFRIGSWRRRSAFTADRRFDPMERALRLAGLPE